MRANRAHRITAVVAVSATALTLASTAPAAPAVAPANIPMHPLVFSQIGASGYDIFRMAADGSGAVALTGADGSDEADETQPVWSPDGTKIAFTRRPADGDGTSDIWVMDADGGNAHNLTATEGVEEVNATWAPDGSRLAYAAQSWDGPEYDYDVWTMAADGSQQTNLTGPGQALAYDDFEPDWSPDGTRIAFAGVRDGAWSLLTIAPDGSDEQVITTGSDRDPAWSPDGKRIVFMRESGDEATQWDIFLTNADGSQTIPLTDHPAADMFPAWSADGTQVLFSSNRADTPQDPRMEMDIYVVDVPPATTAPQSAAAPSPARLTTTGSATFPDWWAWPRRSSHPGRCGDALWWLTFLEWPTRSSTVVRLARLEPGHRWVFVLRDGETVVGRWAGVAPADGSVRVRWPGKPVAGTRLVAIAADLTADHRCRTALTVAG